MATGSKFSIDAVFRAIDRMSGPVHSMQSRVESLSRVTDRGFKLMNKSADSFISTVNTAAKYTAGAGIAMAGGLALAAKSGLDFDQQMANVGAVSLMTRDQVGDLEKKARELGATTKFTATEAAQGMELMGKAGFKNREILEGIGGVLSAAAAEGMELAETAGHVSNVLKGMGLEADQAGRVADVLALASARTNSSISSLGESMSNVSSTARQLGIPLEQVVGSVALLQDVGIDASVAGTAMSVMLKRLATPTDELKAKMRKMGVAFQDAKHNMLPLPVVMANLAKASQKAGGNMDVVAFFSDLVGDRGEKAAANLAALFQTMDVDSGKNKVVTLFEELSHATDGVGSATKMADLRMESVLGQLTLLQSAVDGVRIDLFDLGRGPLKDVVKRMTQWTTANKGLIVSRVQDFIKDVADNMGDIVKWGTRIGKTVAAFYALSLAVKATQTAIDAYVLATRAFGGITWAIRGMAVAMRLYNTEVHMAGNGLSAMRTRLNAGALSQSINGVTGTLGKLGLLGAALGVGYAFGSWVNEITGASDAISKLLAQVSGLEEKLNKSRNADVKDIGNGVLVNTKTREWVNKPMEGATSATYDAWRKGEEVKLGRKAFGLDERPKAPPMSKKRALTPDEIRAQSSVIPSAFDTLAKAPLQMVTPQDRVARSVEENNTTTTNKTEIVITDETGRAKVKKTGKGPSVPVLRPTGAF